MARTMAVPALCVSLVAPACASTGYEDESQPPIAGAGHCEAEAARHLTGETASQGLAAEAMQLSGARELRWIPPDSAVTMDYRPARLNIEYGRDMIVSTIRCG